MSTDTECRLCHTVMDITPDYEPTEICHQCAHKEVDRLTEELAALSASRAGVPVDIDALVDRFLAWQLPASVCSDLCVSMPNYPHARSGTSLLTAREAKQMLEHVLSAAPDPAGEMAGVPVAWISGRSLDWLKLRSEKCHAEVSSVANDKRDIPLYEAPEISSNERRYLAYRAKCHADVLDAHRMFPDDKHPPPTQEAWNADFDAQMDAAQPTAESAAQPADAKAGDGMCTCTTACIQRHTSRDLSLCRIAAGKPFKESAQEQGQTVVDQAVKADERRDRNPDSATFPSDGASERPKGSLPAPVADPVSVEAEIEDAVSTDCTYGYERRKQMRQLLRAWLAKHGTRLQGLRDARKMLQENGCSCLADDALEQAIAALSSEADRR